MTAAELRKKFPNATEAFIRRNTTTSPSQSPGKGDAERPTVPLGAVDGAELEPDAGGRVAGADQLQATGARRGGGGYRRIAARLARGRICIGLIAYRHRRLDEVNLVGACKETQDAIAAAFGIDDGDERSQWSFSQHVWNGRKGVLVEIEWEGLGSRPQGDGKDEV